jgi:integrase
VLRYRIHLEDRKLAPGTISPRLGAVRRLAYKASDCGLLSADLAAGIRRVKGVKKIGVRLGNWLLPDQTVALLEAPDPETMKGKQDLASLAILVACGLRRHEAVELNVSHLQQREDHWAIVDLIGKASHVRTIPVPEWVKDLVDDWLHSAGISNGKIFRRVTRAGTVWGGLRKSFGTLSGSMRGKPASTKLRRTISGELAPGSARQAVNSTRFSYYLDTSRCRPPSDILAASSGFATPSTIGRDTAETPNGFGRLVNGFLTAREALAASNVSRGLRAQ